MDRDFRIWDRELGFSDYFQPPFYINQNHECVVLHEE